MTGKGNVTFLSSASCPTTGTKGTIENVYSVKNALRMAMSRIGRDTSDIDLVRLNEAAPVIGDTAMETLTETVITDSSMIGHNPSTPAGAGQAVGETLLIENISRAVQGTPYILAASSDHSYEEVAAVVNQHEELDIVGIILQADEAVLVENRIHKEIPIIDEVRRSLTRSAGSTVSRTAFPQPSKWRSRARRSACSPTRTASPHCSD